MRRVLRVISWPLVQDMDTETYYLATDATGDTKTQRPKTWAICEIEPLHDTMMRMAHDAGAFDWNEDDDDRKSA